MEELTPGQMTSMLVGAALFIAVLGLYVYQRYGLRALRAEIHREIDELRDYIRRGFQH